MIHRYILNEFGTPVPCHDLLTWGKWYEMDINRRVANDVIGDVEISTVFLALEHGENENGRPLLWETMIFGGEHDQYQRRYSSAEDAKKGHAETVAMVKE